MTKPTNYAVDMYIEKHFDTVIHSKLKEIFGQRIAGEKLQSRGVQEVYNKQLPTHAEETTLVLSPVPGEGKL